MKNLEKTSEVSAVLAVAIASLLLLFMIRTVVLRIVFASSFFLLALLLMFLLFYDSHENGVSRYKLGVQANVGWLIYGLAIVSSLAMLYFPVTKYDLNNSGAFFSSLNLSEIIRVALGYFILTVFPGYIACRAFAQNKLNNGFEKLTLVLALSYIISIVLGLSLSHTAGLTLVNYLIILWAFALACEVLSYAFKRKSVIHIPQHTQTSLIKTSLIIAVCLLLVFSSYLVTLSADPTGYALGGDVSRYVSVSNSFLRGYPFDATYVWFQIFIGMASTLTGLQPIYAFVGMQFLIILFPLSFYTLLRRIFKDDKLATIGTVVTTIAGGLSSIGILGLLSAYNEGSVFSALWTLQTKTQNWPWLSNHFFIVSTMDWSLLMLGFGFLYSFIVGNRSSRLSSLITLIMGSVFIASTFFTHNVLGLVIFLMTILVFSLLDYKYMRRAVLSFTCIILATIIFDALSYNLLINTLLNYYLTYRVFFAGSSSFPYQWGIIAVLILLLSALLIPKLVKIIRKKIEFVESGRRFSIKFISLVCVMMALIIFIVSLALVAIHFNELNISEESIFPWYIYAVRFAPLLQLAILSIPIMLRMKNETRLGCWLMLSWGISAILVIGLNVFFPLFALPLLVNRVLMSVYLPLGALSALTLVSLNLIELPKISFRLGRKHAQVPIKKISFFLLVVLLVFSFLSYTYSIEFFYQGNIQGSMSSDEKNLYMYLEKLPSEETFLTYSYSSYTRISSLTTHKTYAYYQYWTFVTWPTEILFDTSSPEVAYYFLYKLGITDIVLTEQDLATLLETSNGTLVFMLNFFPKVFNNSYASVYSIPNYPLNESSNYVLVEPMTNLNLNPISESLIYDPISFDNLRIVGGSTTFKLEQGVIIQEVKDIKPPAAQYLQLYKGIAIPTALSPTASFKIKGTGNALFNIGFYDAGKGWCWLSHEQGLPSKFFSATNNWTEMNIDLSSILGKSATIQYIDFVATSGDGSPVTVEWADFNVFRQIDANEMSSNVYNLAYNALTLNEVPFRAIEDYKVLKLAPNNVYIYSNPQTGDLSNSYLIGDVKAGSHVVFFCDPATLSGDGQKLLESLGIELSGVVSAENASIGEESLIFPSNLYVENLTVQNSLYPNSIRGYYTTLENTRIPLTITFAVGNGSIAFINLPMTLNIDNTLADITIKAIKNAVVALPEPISSNELKTLPYPEDLFKLGNPGLVNIYNLKGLTDYLYAFSDIKLEGNISMSSDYVVFNETDLFIKKLVLQNTTHQELLENVSVANMCLAGSYNTTLTAQDAIIYRLGGEFPLIETSLNSLKIYVDGSAVNLTIQQNGQEKSLTVSNGSIEFEFAKNFTTNLILQEPVIMLNQGSLDTSWEGIFWYNGRMFTTVSEPERWAINGVLSLEVIQSENVILTKLLHKESISVSTYGKGTPQ